MICAYPIDNKERLLCLTPCSHQEHVCSVCYLRIRSLQRNFHCPACKRDLDHVICTFTEEVTIPVTNPNSLITAGGGSEKGSRRNRGKDISNSEVNNSADVNVAPVTAIVITPKQSFDDYQIWGDKINEAYYIYDSRSQMFVPKFYFDEFISKLWEFKCRQCNVKRKDSKELRGHYFGEHKMHMCLLCMEFKQVFPSEQRVYTQNEYERHLRHGDQDGCNGHPHCEFCKKRYYDSTALFVHLARDHYSCHVCSNSFGVKFRYLDQYKDLENHYRKEHYFCDEPSCIERRFVCFATDVELLTHRIQYHPHLADMNRCIPIQFKYKNGNNNNANNNGNNGGNNEAKTEEGGIGKTARFEGGIGGRIAQGEWQVEFESIIADPRDPNRNILRDEVADTGMSSAAPVEDFPQLPSSGPSPILIANKWINLKEKKGTSKQHFPALPSQPKKPSAIEAFAPARKPAFNVTPSSAVSTTTSVADYVEDYVAISGSGARPVTVVDSLGTWANIKVDKRSQKKKANTNTNVSMRSDEPTTSVADVSSAATLSTTKNTNTGSTKMPAPGLVPNSKGGNQGLSAATSSKDSTKGLSQVELSGYDDFSIDMQRALNESFNEFTVAKSSSKRHEKADPSDYPALQITASAGKPLSSESNSSKSNKVPLPQKKASAVPVSNDWSEALKAVGMTTASKKKNGGITVIKAQKSEADKKLVMKSNSRSFDNLISVGSTAGSSTTPGWKSSTFAPPPPPEDDEIVESSSFNVTDFPPPPPTSGISTSSKSNKLPPKKQEDFNIHKHAGWVSMGGTGDSSKSNKNSNTGMNSRESADFPSLSATKR